MMKTLNSYNFRNKKALIRFDFNVPLNDKFEITDDNRLKSALPTLNKILSDGGSAILMSHLGRPKAGPEEKFSLQHVVGYLSQALGLEVKFAPDCIGAEAKAMAEALEPGQVLLLENLRFYKEEEKGDAEFAQKLAAYGDVYVNDAFGTAHRAHASTAIIARFMPDKVCGFLMQAELDNAQKVLENAEAPFTAIMGGAKISDKILIIERLLDRVNNLIIGGGMSYTFTKALGGNIGNSLCENDKLDLALELIAKAQAKGVNLLLPTDAVIADAFSNDAQTNTIATDQIPDGWMGLDIGPATLGIFIKTIQSSKTILWNGPMGVFEMVKFSNGTQGVAEAIAVATGKGAFSLIGGGDSAAAISKFGFADQVSYVSTGGGALLEYMEGKELPGVVALG
jgi:phosphoglycerate kinase